MRHQFYRLSRIELMKQGLEVLEAIGGQAPPALNLKREAEVGKASQEKEGLQDRRLANVVGPEEDIEAAQTVEIEFRQSPEATNLDAIKMLASRHANLPETRERGTRIRNGRTG